LHIYKQEVVHWSFLKVDQTFSAATKLRRTLKILLFDTFHVRVM
jgi:hypothetical protein